MMMMIMIYNDNQKKNSDCGYNNNEMKEVVIVKVHLHYYPCCI